jgi:hypothetical protein
MAPSVPDLTKTPVEILLQDGRGVKIVPMLEHRVTLLPTAAVFSTSTTQNLLWAAMPQPAICISLVQISRRFRLDFNRITYQFQALKSKVPQTANSAYLKPCEYPPFTLWRKLPVF